MPIYVDLEGTTQDEFFHFLIEEIAVAVATISKTDVQLNAVVESLSYHGYAEAEYTDRFFNHDLRILLEALQQFGEIHHEGQQLRLILLLDEMDVISKYDHLTQQQLRRIFMRDFSATLGAVVAGIQISKEWDRVESPWFNLFNEIALEPFARVVAAHAQNGCTVVSKPCGFFQEFGICQHLFGLRRKGPGRVLR